jgi:hypothetical protein
LPLSSDYAGLVFIASEHDSQEPAERCPFPFPLQLPDIVLVRGGRPGFCTDEEFFSPSPQTPDATCKAQRRRSVDRRFSFTRTHDRCMLYRQLVLRQQQSSGSEAAYGIEGGGSKYKWSFQAK